jgi:hypothetical protein
MIAVIDLSEYAKKYNVFSKMNFKVKLMDEKGEVINEDIFYERWIDFCQRNKIPLIPRIEGAEVKEKAIMFGKIRW